MRIHEIQRTPDFAKKIKSEKQPIPNKIVKNITMLPGSKRFGYVFRPINASVTGASHALELYDMKSPNKTIEYVAFLLLARYKSFPAKNAWIVTNVGVEDDYRGKGYGLTLYIIATKYLNMTIVADETQTKSARRMWVNLSNVPEIQVYGYTYVGKDSWENRNNPDEFMDENDKRIIKLLQKAGGFELPGKDKYYTYVAFPVQGGPDDPELKSIQKGLSIYSREHPDSGGTINGLIARYANK